MKHQFMNYFFVAVFILVVLNGWMYIQQPSMIFYPSSELVEIPSDWGLPYDDVTITTTDSVQLHGWYLPSKNATRTVLFFHGNGGNISHRGDSLSIFHRLGLNVFIFDYRGYGLSQGKPSEDGIYLDAMAAWQYLMDKHGFKGENIILFGRSLGGAVATNLARKVRPGALILESTFSSVKDMARILLPLMSRLVYVRYEFDTLADIEHVASPLLVLHSPEDDIIPYKLGEKVYQAANTPKWFVKMQGDHNSGFLQTQPAYERALQKFLQEYRDN